MDLVKYNKAVRLMERGKYSDAIKFFSRSGLSKEALLNMGNCYRALGDYSKSLECYMKSNTSDTLNLAGDGGGYALAMNNIGLSAYAVGADDLAIGWYKSALELNPLYCDAIWNYSNSKLRKCIASGEVGSSEDWDIGWKMYEWRFKRESAPIKMNVGLPRWDGVSPVNIVCEQGIGDKIMFGRYVSEVASVAPVHVVCADSLKWFFRDYSCSESLRYNTYEPLCSLAGRYGVGNKAWLAGSVEAEKLDGFNIGVSWTGSATHANNSNRSCSSSYFSRFADFGNVYNLNPAVSGAKGIKDLNSKSWEETARFVAGLDLVISVDTSIVHLAGSLGVPVLMVQPLRDTDFRWGYGGPSIWYDNFFAVPNVGWEETFNDIYELVKLNVQNS